MRSHKELLDHKIPNSWVIRNLLPVGGLWMLAGQPKAGKSYQVTGVAHAIVNPAIDWYDGYKVDLHGRVLYCNADMPTSSHQRRFKLLDLNGDFDFNNLYHLTIDEIPPTFDLLQEGHRNWLKAIIADLKPVAVIFDVIRRFYSGDENSSDVAGRFIQGINEVISEGNSAGILLHHANKTSDMAKNFGIDKDPISAVRGSSVIAGSMDTISAFNDAGNQLWYQGRDINLKYGLKRDFNGIPYRWIRKNNNNVRGDQIQQLGVDYLLQEPKLGKDDVFNLCVPHVDDFTYEEFEQRWAGINSKFLEYSQ